MIFACHGREYTDPAVGEQGRLFPSALGERFR
jgi:hypothetical protein